jgi:hypothetical protein
MYIKIEFENLEYCLILNKMIERLSINDIHESWSKYSQNLPIIYRKEAGYIELEIKKEFNKIKNNDMIYNDDKDINNLFDRFLKYEDITEISFNTNSKVKDVIVPCWSGKAEENDLQTTRILDNGNLLIIIKKE